MPYVYTEESDLACMHAAWLVSLLHGGYMDVHSQYSNNVFSFLFQLASTRL